LGSGHGGIKIGNPDEGLHCVQRALVIRTALSVFSRERDVRLG
jgi:hypothetical protein